MSEGKQGKCRECLYWQQLMANRHRGVCLRILATLKVAAGHKIAEPCEPITDDSHFCISFE